MVHRNRFMTKRYDKKEDVLLSDYDIARNLYAKPCFDETIDGRNRTCYVHGISTAGSVGI